MISIFFGIILIAFTVVSCLPMCLNWGADIVAFLKGFGPFLAAFVGIIAIFIGAADVKDKKEAKKDSLENNK